MKVHGFDDAPGATPERVLEHLEEILRSPAFSSSKRCREFLSYVVLESVHGRSADIKERNIALEVFGKGSDFEPGEDSLVRVKAREVRKRLSEYYNTTSDHGLKVEMPVGGYAPRIQATERPADPPISVPVPVATEPAAETPAVASRFSRRTAAWMLGGGVVAAAGATSLARLIFPASSPLDRLWRPVFASRVPLLVYVPVLTERSDGNVSDRVGIGPTAVVRQAADYLARHNYPYQLRFGDDLTFAQLREQPSLLLGGFSSTWTARATDGLRYVLVSKDADGQPCIRDVTTGQSWRTINERPNGYADQDYGLFCRIFDAHSGQIVLLAAGLTTFATAGAGSIFFDPVLFRSLLQKAPSNWETKNIQAVVRVSIIGTTSSPPEIVATHFW